MRNTASPAASPLRAALYCRVSRDDEKQGRSVTEQEEEGRALADREGWSVDTVVTEGRAISSSRFETRARQAWPTLVAELEDGRYDVLVLWESSRGSRDLTAWSAFLDTCRRHGVLIHIVSDHRTYDPRIARDWGNLAEDGIDSAYESEKTSKRILRTVAARATAGEPHGPCPYGYARTYDPRSGTLNGQDPDPETAPVVREIIARVAEAVPISTITADLNGRGVPSPKGGTWARAVVRRTATNPAYIGKRIHKGESFDASWEPLVSLDDFYGARAVLSDPKRKTTKPGGVKHLLSYIATCAECGARLAGSSRGYVCSAHGCVQAKLELVEEVVEAAVVTRLEESNIAADLAGRDDAAATAARDEAAALRARLDDFRDSAAEGEITPASLARVESKLLVKIEEAEKRAVLAATPAGLRAMTGSGSVQERWQRSSIGTKREIIRLLLEVKVARASAPGRHATDDTERVQLTYL